MRQGAVHRAHVRCVYHMNKKFVSLTVIAGFIAFGLLFSELAWRIAASLRSFPHHLVSSPLALAFILALTLLARRVWPALAAPDIAFFPNGSRQEGVWLLCAIAGGAALFTGVYGITRGLGGISVQWQGPHGWLLLGKLALMLATTAVAVAWEEYLFRGWAFAVGVRGLGPHGVALFLGVGFGLAHLLNPDWTLAAIVSTALAGLFLNYALLVTRTLMVPIGLHIGWNFAQSLLLSQRFWSVNKSPSLLLSGGNFGLEASVVGLVITGIAAAGMVVRFLTKASP